MRKMNPNSRRWDRAPAACLVVLLLLAGCGRNPAGPPATATAVASPAATARTAAAPPPVETVLAPPATPVPVLQPVATLPPLDCGADPAIGALVRQVQPGPWLAWVQQLSGAAPVSIGGRPVTLTTRYTPAMFAKDAGPSAFDFVLQTVRGWYPARQIEVQEFEMQGESGETITAKNLILSLPGAARPGEVVILSAHLDSLNRDRIEPGAPGAEDNASGSAALLEAARLFRGRVFERTVRIIWFTGEEQGLQGSQAYVNGLRDPRSILGVVNLDMFGYDSDGDRCFEMHVGGLPESDRVGRCILQSIEAYQIGLPRFDYLDETQATDRSDHGSFWSTGVGAVEILENMCDNQLPGGCPGADRNPNYHTAQDTYETLNPVSAARIVRAAIAAVAAMARLAH